MEIIQKIALVLTIVGALNWGLIGILDINLVSSLIKSTMINNIIKCPHCGKPVGEYIIKGSISSPIGAILDGQPSYKKPVSNIYWREKMGSEGLL